MTALLVFAGVVVICVLLIVLDERASRKARRRMQDALAKRRDGQR